MVGLYSAGLILNNVVGYWVYISVGLYLGAGGLYSGAYIWNEVCVRYMWWGLYLGGGGLIYLGACIWNMPVKTGYPR